MQPRVPTVRAKKAATRMRKKNSDDPGSSRKQPRSKSNSRESNSNSPVGGEDEGRGRGNKSALQLLQDHPADTSVDSFIEVQELLSIHHDDDDDNGGGDGGVLRSPQRKIGAAGRGGSVVGGGGGTIRTKSEVSLDLSATGGESGGGEELVTLDDLRAVFEQSLQGDEFLAEKG